MQEVLKSESQLEEVSNNRESLSSCGSVLGAAAKQVEGLLACGVRGGRRHRPAQQERSRAGAAWRARRAECQCAWVQVTSVYLGKAKAEKVGRSLS